jgi:CarD-like/TRCF domain
MRFDFFGKIIDTEKCVRPPLRPKPRQHFTIGDPIIYPGVGIGVIQEIRNISGMDFFVIALLKGESRILVPMHKLASIGAVLLDQGY